MTEPIDKGRLPVAGGVARWALVVAILALAWAVRDGLGPLRCVCEGVGALAAKVGAIQETLKPTLPPGPGGGAGTISLGSGGGGGGNMTTNWSITEGTPEATETATAGASLTIRADAEGIANVFEGRPGATPWFTPLAKYTVRIKQQDTETVRTLTVSKTYTGRIDWHLADASGTEIPLTFCDSDPNTPNPECTGDLPPELFGTIMDFNAEPLSGPPMSLPFLVRTQTQ